MKKNILLLIVFLLGSNLSAQEFNVITYNIRNNNPKNNDGENAWSFRRKMVCQLLEFHDADIFGIQEAYYDQVQYIDSYFKKFRWIGVGRDDGEKAGEFSPIFYNYEIFQLKKKGWFWLSETPNKPSKGWDASNIRICTWGLFSHKTSGRDFFIFNTHFDNRGVEAKKHSVDLVLQKIKELNKEKIPLIFMGDLNMSPQCEFIEYLKKYLYDSRDISEEPAYGPYGTTNGFNFLSDLKKRIDYIFVNDRFAVKKYAVLSDSKDTRYFSDHLPVFVRLGFKE